MFAEMLHLYFMGTEMNSGLVSWAIDESEMLMNKEIKDNQQKSFSIIKNNNLEEL